MKYNSELHFAQSKPWTSDDINYLKEWYNVAGMEEMSLALGRTEPSILKMIAKLRKQGLMGKEKRRTMPRLLRKATKETDQSIPR
jgi:Mn-dependent DtxR family transcriptional regulator